MTVEENKALVRRQVNAIWNDHKLESLGEYVDDGPLFEESKEHIEQFLTAFPDCQTTIEDIFGEGDKVAARLYATATNTGPFAGNPPTGKKVEIRSIRIYRIADGKVVETWAMQDRLGLMEQLGIAQSTGEVNWADGEED